MVLSFIRGDSGHGGFEDIVAKSVAMLGDAYQSFELATTALLSDGGADAISQDIRDLDRRINRTENQLRRELVEHASVHGRADIASVVGLTLLLKKIERVGDHAKNILELTESGVSLADVPENETLLAERQILSDLFAQTAELVTNADSGPDAVADFAEEVNSFIADCQARIDSYVTSDRPGHEVVPLAIYYRFLRRISANLLGLVWAAVEPLPDVGEVDPDE